MEDNPEHIQTIATMFALQRADRPDGACIRDMADSYDQLGWPANVRQAVESEALLILKGFRQSARAKPDG